MMPESDRTALCYEAMKEMHPEYFETEDNTEKEKIMSIFHDEVFEAGLTEICRTIFMLKDLSSKRGEDA